MKKYVMGIICMGFIGLVVRISVIVQRQKTESKAVCTILD